MMSCASCNTENPDGAKFCMSCGSALALACPSCGTALPSAEARFCPSCGHKLGEDGDLRPDGGGTKAQAERLAQFIPPELLAKLDTARAGGGMQGERRIVTMLFCDVTGSTAAAHSLDPEDWAEIMNGAFEHLIAPVYRYEGTLARLMGDAILAFFGAPIGHEDDPERAVLAGLDILASIGPYRAQVKERWGFDFDVRVGINTGLVVVGEVGSDLRLEYSALGDAVNMASRMESTATPGTIQITEATHKLIAPLFDFDDLGGVEVKGHDEPVHAFRVLGAKAERGSQRGIEGLGSPLVGREAELAQLQGAVAELLRGRGQIVSVMGEAGLGKSRLVAELRRDVLEREPSILWLEGRSLSYDASTPYAPMIDLLSSYLEIGAGSPNGGGYAALRERIERVMGERVREVAPFIASMLGVPVDAPDADSVAYLQPPQLREGVFTAVCALLERLAADRPTVVALEDLHWADPASLELFERLLPLPDRSALMVLALFRPQRQDPSWHFHEVAERDYEHLYTSVRLEPLDEAGSRELIENLLRIEGLSENVRSLILAKAEGNPFFVEEVIRSLLDSGVVVPEGDHWRSTRDLDDIAVPDTLSAVITTRLDRLGEESKQLIGAASVIGREFGVENLKAITTAKADVEPLLADLQRRGLVRESARIPERRYRFKHTLTQDTAYGSLLLAKRRELHLRVGDLLERQDPSQVNDISRHLLEAREDARALPYLVDAADRAAGAYATPQAIAQYTRAVEIANAVDDIAIAQRAYEGLGGALTLANRVDEALDTYGKMGEFGAAHGRNEIQVSALNKSAFLKGLLQGDFEEADRLLQRAEELAKPLGECPSMAETHMVYCYARTLEGDFDEAFDRLSQAEEISRHQDLVDGRLFSMTHLANTLNHMTRYEEAKEMAGQALDLAREAGNRVYEAELLGTTLSVYYISTGDLRSAQSHAEQGLAIAKEIGSAQNTAGGSMMLATISRLQGDYERSVGCWQSARETSGSIGLAYIEAAALGGLGGTYLDISPELAPRTREYHTAALQMMDGRLANGMGTMVWAEIGFCALAQGDAAQAKALFDLALTEPTSARIEARPQALIGLALLALEGGNAAEAVRLLAEVRTFTHERDMAHFYPFVDMAAGTVAAATSAPEEALAHFAHAETAAIASGMRPVLWQVRAGAAAALSTLGRNAESEAKLAEARETVDAIAQTFDDETLRGLFLENAARKLKA